MDNDYITVKRFYIVIIHRDSLVGFDDSIALPVFPFIATIPVCQLEYLHHLEEVRLYLLKYHSMQV